MRKPAPSTAAPIPKYTPNPANRRPRRRRRRAKWEKVSFELDVRGHCFERLGADPFYGAQVVERAERAVGLAVLYEPGGQRGADARQLGQLGDRGMVDV